MFSGNPLFLSRCNLSQMPLAPVDDLSLSLRQGSENMQFLKW